MNKPLKRALLIYVLFSFISLNGNAQVLTADLISLWELKDTGVTFYDSIGNHNGFN